MNLFPLLLPDLALIAIGFVLSRKADWGSDLWPGIGKLTYYVRFPTLLFHAIVRNPVQWGSARTWLPAYCWWSRLRRRPSHWLPTPGSGSSRRRIACWRC